MTFWLFSMLAAAAIAPGDTSKLAAGEWNLSAAAESSCEASADGRADDALGATVFIACGEAGDLANASYKFSAGGWRQRRLSIAADLQASGAGASLWIKVMRGSETLLLVSTADESMFEDTTQASTRRSLSVVVPSDATAIAYGVRLHGRGQVEANNLHLTLAAPGATAPEAQRVLDAAFAIVKQQAGDHQSIDWRVLETQARIFAAGAKETAEVYPAIQYVLTQIGDPRSLLLKPDIASLFHATSASSGAAMGVFVLPDGAKLVLSMPAAEHDARIAKVLSTQSVY